MIPRHIDRSHLALRDLLGAYALDAIEPTERRTLDEHLASCDTCPRELARLRSAVAAYPLALPDREPSAALRGRIESALGPPPSRAIWGGAVPPPAPPVPTGPPPRATPTRFRTPAGNPWAVAAVLLLAVSLGLLIWNLQLRSADDAAVVDTVALRAADPNAPVDGELTYLADRGVAILSVRTLPDLEPDEVYQVWIIREGAAPEPAGAFAAAVAEIAVAVDRDQYQTLALTIEPGPLGSPDPTGAPIAQAPLAAT